MDIESHYFEIKKTSRYFTLGSIQESKYLIFVLHGYGQLPFYFSRKIESLVELGYYVVLPEGLHRFYVSGASGRVGASWMTKEDRLTDIADNLNYLTSLYNKISNLKKFEKIELLGFSQGGATAFRWSTSLSVFSKVIIWASLIPEDFIVNQTSRYYFVVGTSDPFLPIADISDQLKLYKEKGICVIQYEGIHSIDQNTLLGLVSGK
jgi:predicted esterase